MKITHVTLRYPPASGGVEDYVHTIVGHLRAAGDDADVETTTLATHHPATFLPSPIADPPYVHRHAVRRLHGLAYPLPRTLRASLLRSRPAIIHAHAVWYAPAEIAARAARSLHVPFVLNPYYTPRRKMLWRVYERFLGVRTVSAADAVVVISPQEETALRDRGYSPRRTVLVPPGVNPEEFQPHRADPFAARGLTGKRIILTAGRIARAKGLDLILRALPTILRDIPDAHLVCAGEDFGEKEDLERLAERLGVSRAVTWLGKLSREELLAAYAHAQAFAFPSRYEAFGIVALEAQAAGCPVVATDTTSIPFVVQDGKTGLLFRPEDADDLASNVLAILKDPALAERLTSAARARAYQEFLWDRSIAKLRALYAELVHGVHPRTQQQP